MEGYKEAQHQAAGHKGALVDGTGSLFIKPTTKQEIDFYTQAQDHLNRVDHQDEGGDEDEDEEEYDTNLFDWMPAFLGTLQQGVSDTVEASNQVTQEMRQLIDNSDHHTGVETIATKDKEYAVLENMLHGFTKPAIIDIKLGSKLYDDDDQGSVDDKKKQRMDEVSRSTTSGSLNYRVCGMKLYGTTLPSNDSFDNIDHNVHEEDGYITFDKWYGRALTAKNVTQSFKLFFTHNNLSKERQQVVIQNTFTRLQLLYNCLLSTEVRIISGSVFLAFENDLERWESKQDNDPVLKDDSEYDEDDDNDDEDEHEHENKTPLSLLSLIDFAHAKFTPGEGPDENILVGIENLLDAIEPLIE